MSDDEPASVEAGLPPSEIERSLAIPPRECAVSAVMVGFSDPYVVPFALALGASPFEAGLLTSVRNLILSLAQRWTAEGVAWFRSRKRLVLASVAVQVASFVPLVFLGLHPGEAAVAALILCYTIGSTASAYSGPAWASLIAGYLGPAQRGAYWGRISRNVGVAMTLATFAGGGVLELLHGRPLLGFGLLMAGAAVARAISLRMLTGLAEGPWEEASGPRATLLEFVRESPRTNFGRFTLAVSLTSFGVNLAVPFYAVWVLEDLRYGYFVYALTQFATTAATALVVPAWGRAGDRLGHQAVLRWTGFALVALPFLWPLFDGHLGLVLVALATGVVSGGYNLSVTNFIFDAEAPGRRARSLAYFNLVNGCAVSAGALLGGWLLFRLPAIGGSVYVPLFILSGLVRLAGAILFRVRVREVKPVRETAFHEILAAMARMPVGQLLTILEVPRPGMPWRRRRGMG